MLVSAFIALRVQVSLRGHCVVYQDPAADS